MFFQLLSGMHQEPGKDPQDDPRTYRVNIVRDEKTGAIVSMTQPVVESGSNLVDLFGPNKFRELSKDEALYLMNQQGVEDSVSAPNDSEEETEEETLVARAARKGAAGVKPSFGRDVTAKWPTAAEADLLVYVKPGGRYSVVDLAEGEPVVLNTKGPLKKAEVEDFLAEFVEEVDEDEDEQ